MDKYVESFKKDFDKGNRRRVNPEYTKIIRTGKYSAKITRKLGIIPGNMVDKNFKRLLYVRYADDFLIGIDGSKEDSQKVMCSVKNFLIETLNFELKDNFEILNFRTTTVNFLGMTLKGHRLDLVPTIKSLGRKVRSPVRPIIIMPISKVKNKLFEMGFLKKHAQQLSPTRCGRLIHHDLYRIVDYYNSIYRGICGYYHVAMNRALLSRIHYFLKYSCALTIANKMKLKTKAKVFKKYGSDLTIEKRGRKISFVQSNFWKTIKKNYFNVELPLEGLRRYTSYSPKVSLFDYCVSCSSKQNLEMHHLNKVSNIKNSDYLSFIKRSNQRKQIVLCSSCHHEVHNGVYSLDKL